MLRLIDVCKSFGNQRVVERITYEFSAHRTHVLIGPSGCGKSTLLRMLIGLIPADSGEIQLDGEALEDLEVRQMRKRFGYVIQSGGLFPHLTARQNISLAATWHRWPQGVVYQRIRELIQLTRFPENGLERYPGQLSGGQRQRVSLMRALVLDPDILLLDEPLGALDPMIRSQLQRELKSVFQQLRKTVVLVTHDLSEAAWFADRVVLMREGGIEQQGEIGDLIERPASDFVAEFIRAQQSHLPRNPDGGKTSRTVGAGGKARGGSTPGTGQP